MAFDIKEKQGKLCHDFFFFFLPSIEEIVEICKFARYTEGKGGEKFIFFALEIENWRVSLFLMLFIVN